MGLLRHASGDVRGLAVALFRRLEDALQLLQRQDLLPTLDGRLLLLVVVFIVRVQPLMVNGDAQVLGQVLRHPDLEALQGVDEDFDLIGLDLQVAGVHPL